MHNLSQLEEYFQKFIKQIHHGPAEQLLEVNLALLQQLGLLNFYNLSSYNPALTRYFHVIETQSKITLINEDFVVWIVPEKNHRLTRTYTLIAINKKDQPYLELAMVNSGIYNNSRLILRILEKLLFDIEENEAFLRNIS